MKELSRQQECRGKGENALLLKKLQVARAQGWGMKGEGEQ